MRRALALFFLLSGCQHAAPAGDKKAPAPPVDLAQKAKELSQRFIIADGHIDVPYRMEEWREEKKDQPLPDLSKRTEDGNFDFVRAREGGLDAPFMSIYVPARFQEEGGAKAMADHLIDLVESFEKQWPDKFRVTRSVPEVRENFKEGRVSLLMGIENGAAVEDDVSNVEHFYERGVRYITLTHSKDNLIGDSSYDETRTHKGLSDFGKKVVAEMNRLGILVDISHVSDDTFYGVLEVTKVPVIASHSSCRHFVPEFERNMNDDMIKALAQNGGVMLINFGSSFVSDASRKYYDQRHEASEAFAEKNGIERDHPKVEAFVDEWEKEHPRVYATVEDVADHIDHVVKLVGIDHVGFGSDFDGVGNSLPAGLKDVSQYPNLIRVLLERGYSEEDIEKICSQNLFRVWDAVSTYAAGH